MMRNRFILRQLKFTAINPPTSSKTKKRIINLKLVIKNERGVSVIAVYSVTQPQAPKYVIKTNKIASSLKAINLRNHLKNQFPNKQGWK